MSDAKIILSKAQELRDLDEADRQAVTAILAEPDYAAAYAFRAHLAIRRADVVSAAHHLRAAFSRGDRTPSIVAALSVCLAAAGQAELARRIRGTEPIPATLEDFVDLAATQSGLIRQVFQSPLPEKGQPVLLPTDLRLEATLSPRASEALAGEVTAVDGARGLGGPSLSGGGKPRAQEAIPPLPTLPTAVPLPSGGPPAASPALHVESVLSEPPLDKAPEVVPRRPAGLLRGEEARPAWLDNIERGPIAVTTRAAWALTTAESVEVPVGIFEGSRVDLAWDPNASEAEPGPADPLEALPAFEGVVPREDIRVALRLPGPVMTAAGVAPQQLCRVVALAVTPSEVLLRDLEQPKLAPVRLPFAGLERLELLKQSQHLAFTLRDGRQVHLDLRGLRLRALRAALALNEALREGMERR